MNRKRIGRFVEALIVSLGFAGTSAFTLAALPPRQS
jgi:hypothetical protein